MSRTFYIKNTKAPKVMNLSELLAIAAEDLEQFALSKDDEDYDALMAEPLSEFHPILVACDDFSGRGFELGYDREKDCYKVIAFTPSTLNDWRTIFETIARLANHLSVEEVIDEEENAYQAGHITYDYREDIAYGIDAMLSRYETGKTIAFFGYYRPMVLGEEEITQLQAAADRVQFFSDWVEEQQHIDAHYARLRFVKDKEGTIIGNYMLSSGLPTILPYELPPLIDVRKWDITAEGVGSWQLSLMAVTDNTKLPNSYEDLGTVDYQAFLNRLPEHKKERLDGHYMVVTLTQEEMKAIRDEE